MKSGTKHKINGARTSAEASNEEMTDVAPSASKQPQLNKQTLLNDQTRRQDFVDADEAEQDVQREARCLEWQDEQESERLACLRQRLGLEANEAERDTDKVEEDVQREARCTEWCNKHETGRLARLHKRLGLEANEEERDTTKWKKMRNVKRNVWSGGTNTKQTSGHVLNQSCATSCDKHSSSVFGIRRSCKRRCTRRIIGSGRRKSQRQSSQCMRCSRR